MGGKTTKTSADKLTGIQMQTSSYGLAIPVCYGTNRGGANLVWYGAFKAIPHTTKTSSTGKGGTKSVSTTYTYQAAAILAVSEGAIAGIGKVWKDRDQTTLTDIGLTLFTGDRDQTMWSYLSTYYGSQDYTNDIAYGYAGQDTSGYDPRVTYSSTAYLAASAYDLGDSASISNHNFEIKGMLIYGGSIVDSNPADFIPDMLTSEQYGVGMTSAQIYSMTNYSNYCRALGLFLSPIFTEQKAGADHLNEIMELTNSAVVWSDGVLKIIPYGDQVATGNGATYTPNLTPLFDLDDDDFLDNDPPIEIKRSDPEQLVNRVTVNYSDRVSNYNTLPVDAEDQNSIELNGLKPAAVISTTSICLSAVAKLAAQLYLQRKLYKRCTYTFSLNNRYRMLEPMDIVTVSDPDQDLIRVPVRITSIAEIDGGFDVEAEDFPIGIAAAAAYHHDDGIHWQSEINAVPNSPNAPFIYELPADPQTTGLGIGIAIGAATGDAIYGGCRCWMSLDGINYKDLGILYGSSRYGALTANTASHAVGADTTNSVAVHLISQGQLVTASAADAAKGSTLCVVGTEYFSYQTATLTGTDAYTLTNLYRGQQNSTPAAHVTTDKFARIDESTFQLEDLDLGLIGQTLHFKFTSFNKYEHGEQDLSVATEYTYTVTGWAKAQESPVEHAIDSDNLGGTPAADVVNGLEETALQSLYNNLAMQNLQGWVQGVVYDPLGKPIQTVSIDAKNVADNAITILNLIGAMSIDSSAFVFNTSNVIIGDETLAQYMVGVQTSLDDNTASITELFESVDGVSAEVTLVTNVNGQVVGTKFGTTGTTSYFDIVSPTFRLIDNSNPANITVPMEYVGGILYLQNVTVRGELIVVGSVTDSASIDVGSHTNIGSEYSITSVSINPDGGRVRISFRVVVDNPGASDCAIRVKIFRDGTNISGSMLDYAVHAFTKTFSSYVYDYSGPTVDTVYSISVQTVTGTSIGDTGGTPYAANLAGANLTAETFKV